MIEVQPKAMGGGDRKSEEYHRGTENPGDPSGNITLADAGIDKNLAKVARKLHSMPRDEFEEMISERHIIHWHERRLPQFLAPQTWRFDPYGCPKTVC